jgi:pyruvate-ferredoxin/flavodoxin oxidoreductase
MRLRKKKTQADAYRFPGTSRAIDGHAAVYAVETSACDAILVQSGTDWTEITGPLRRITPHGEGLLAHQPDLIRRVDSLKALAALTTGHALLGLRSSALTSSLSGIHEALQAAVGKRVTCVFNLTCRALQRHAGSLHGGHDDYYGISGAGLFQLFARNTQEVADFTLIAHRVAELSLTPGLCAQDFYRTSHSVQDTRMPEADLALAYLGRPDDTIPSPTPSQEVLFGKERRRIPMLVDRDHPVGIGGVQDQESYFKALAAQRSFFSEHLEAIIETAMREFGELTGRFYEAVPGYRAEDADVLVIAQGAVVEELEVLADYLRERENVKAGVLNMSMFRPFPGPRLTHWLRRKAAVTVLERVDQPLAEDLPLMKEVRSAVDKAVENGATHEEAPVHPSYEPYRRPTDRPQIFSGIYGVGGEVPSFEALLAVFRNMLPRGLRRRTFYVGAGMDPAARRFPHLHTLQQRLVKGYPDLEGLSLPPAAPAVDVTPRGHTVQLHALSVQGGLFAANLFAQTLAAAMGRQVRTFPQGGLEQYLQPTCVSILHGAAGPPLKSKPSVADTVLISSDYLIETVSSRAPLKENGTVIVGSNRNPEDLWRTLSNRTARWVREQSIRFYVIDARKVASETASKPAFVDQLAIWALFGAYLQANPEFFPEDLQTFQDHFRVLLGRLFGPGHDLIEEIAGTVARGAEDLLPLDWDAWTDDDRPVIPESETPWTVRRAHEGHGTVFDLKRFWHSVGYLYDSGQPDQTLTDPYVATGIIPARSSAFRDMTPYRLRVPDWLAENCTGCGLCWAFCPDSALPPTIQSVSDLIDTAMAGCEKNGTAMVQMQRLGGHLAKQAYRLIEKDDLHQYKALGPVLEDAFSQLIEKMDLQADKLEVLTAEFRQIHDVVRDYRVAKTETFFDQPHKRDKGSGKLLTIALNPLSCKACGLCLEVCPENAFEWGDQTPELLKQINGAWQFQMTLPKVADESIREHISAADPQAHVHRLLDRDAYHSLVGGDGAFPGNTVKTAVHLLTATIESVMRSRFSAHVDRLSQLIAQIEDKIQGKVSSTVKINDFEEFAEKLSHLDRRGISADALARLLGGDPGMEKIDEAQLKRLTDILGRLKEQRRLYLEGADGSGRARMAMTIDPGGASMWSGTYPYNPHAHPWVCHLPGDAPALAEGVFDGIMRILTEEVITCRRAQLEVDDEYDPVKHATMFDAFGWRDFAAEEESLIPPVLVLGEVGTTPWEDVSRLLSGDVPIKVALINTRGVALSGEVGGFAEHAGGRRFEWRSDMGFQALAHRNAFVLQGSVGHPGHLMRGVAEGLAGSRPALFHIYAPDPQNHGIAPEKVVEQARLAYESRAFPLYTFDPERPDGALTLEDNPDIGKDWTTHDLTLKNPSGEESKLTIALTVADWAVREARFQEYFRVVSKGYLSEQMKPLPEYLEIEPEQRGSFEPYINVVDDKQRHFLAIVSPAMVRMSEEKRTFWAYLRELARSGSVPLGPVAQVTAGPPPPDALPPEPPPPTAAVPEASTQEKLTERLLWLSGFSRDPEFFKQSLREFVTQRQQARVKEEDHGGTPD